MGTIVNIVGVPVNTSKSSYGVLSYLSKRKTAATSKQISAGTGFDDNTVTRTLYNLVAKRVLVIKSKRRVTTRGDRSQFKYLITNVAFRDMTRMKDVNTKPSSFPSTTGASAARNITYDEVLAHVKTVGKATSRSIQDFYGIKNNSVSVALNNLFNRGRLFRDPRDTTPGNRSKWTYRVASENGSFPDFSEETSGFPGEKSQKAPSSDDSVTTEHCIQQIRKNLVSFTSQIRLYLDIVENNLKNLVVNKDALVEEVTKEVKALISARLGS